MFWANSKWKNNIYGSYFSLTADNNFKILILLARVGPLVSQNTARIDEVLDDRKFDV